MGKRSVGKVIAIVAAIVVVIAGASVGVLAACGVFSASPKSKAIDLLSQAPEKILHSSVDEYLGMGELNDAVMKKGSKMECTLSNLQLDDLGAANIGGIDLSQFTADFNISTDVDGKSSMLMGLAKGDSRLSLNYYADKEKICASLPELLGGKVLSVKYSDLQSLGDGFNKLQGFSLSQDEIQKLKESLEGFLENEIGKFKNDIVCEKIEGSSEGYKVTVTKAAMDNMINDFVTYVQGEKTITDILNTFITYFGYSSSLSGNDLNMDINSILKMASSALTQYTRDVSFSVYGENGDLRKIEFSETVQQLPLTISVEFEGSTGDSKTIMKAIVTEKGQEAGITAVLKDRKADVCESSLVMDVTANGTTVASLEAAVKLNPSDNAFETSFMAGAGEENIELSAKGSVKDLKQGNSMNFVLDDVSLSQGNKTLLTMAMSVKYAVQDGSVEAPQGEEIDIKNTAELEKYGTEISSNFMNIIQSWGLSNLIPSSAGGSSYNSGLLPNIDDYSSALPQSDSGDSSAIPSLGDLL